MKDEQKRAGVLSDNLDSYLKNIDIDKLEHELAELDKQVSDADLWSNHTKAQTIIKNQAQLKNQIEPWRKLSTDLDEVKELLDTKDKSLSADLRKQLDELETRYQDLKNKQKTSGPYDQNSAIISIHAGAGGVDAQDWASMLLRMYLRWAQAHGFKTDVINESSGEEAGIKSADLSIEGDLVYGQLKGEHGVHRLVRLSPFNADNLRQTSFAKVEVLPKINRPSDLVIDEKDLKIDVFRSGGRGGQSVNTTDSAVRITHLPTAITVTIQNERSQLQNKETAMTLLRSKLAQLQLEQHKDKLSEIKGPSQSAEWGNQIRSYVLHPYKQVKDLRTKFESKDPKKVLDGDLDDFIKAYLDHSPYMKATML